LTGLDLDEAQSLGWLSQPIANALPLPNDPDARTALGVLHANCGACHSDTGAKKDKPLRLRLFTGVQSFEDTDFFHTALGQEASRKIDGLRIYAQAGHPDDSLIVRRMSHRDDDLQMPPLATEKVDSDGVATVRAFLQSLAP
jgi:hypothetical protein